MQNITSYQRLNSSNEIQKVTPTVASADGGFRAAIATGFGLLGVGSLVLAPTTVGVSLAVVSFVLGVLAVSCLRLVNEWDRLIVLRLGKFHEIKKPGLIFLLPVIDRIAARIDTRVQVSPFEAQQTLTRDTVPVDVDAVLFWYVFDVKKASLEVADYSLAVTWAAQTALRDIIGRSLLAELLSERATLEKLLQQIIEERTAAWGIQLQAVEVRDVQIPENLQDAMSREAQAEREKKARVILSEAEKEIAANFLDAANQYESNKTALTLRGWNIIREGLKEKGNVVLIPTDTLNSLGTAGSALALQNWVQQTPPSPKNENGTQRLPQADRNE
jgi:regulator of protease activity HflC (stomatin/prohibitin superfamily)